MRIRPACGDEEKDNIALRCSVLCPLSAEWNEKNGVGSVIEPIDLGDGESEQPSREDASISVRTAAWGELPARFFLS